jgi:hypothetical protein
MHPHLLGMKDLARWPVMSWPSVTAFAQFRRYWVGACAVLETSRSLPITAERADNAMQELGNSYSETINALDGARALPF